jgi:hypothetical protein
LSSYHDHRGLRRTNPATREAVTHRRGHREAPRADPPDLVDDAGVDARRRTVPKALAENKIAVRWNGRS